MEIKRPRKHFVVTIELLYNDSEKNKQAGKVWNRTVYHDRYSKFETAKEYATGYIEKNRFGLANTELWDVIHCDIKDTDTNEIVFVYDAD